MRKLFSIFAALTLSAGLWAAAPANAESVDLGLPSGLKWATFNVGATAPEGNGDYFAWGVTEPYYSSQDPLTWKTGKEAGYDWPSYCGSGKFTEWSTAPYDATTKNLKPEFDAATANWGSDWRMPTKAEYKELMDNCTWTWTADYNGTSIKGYVITSKAEGNTNSIFLPASGYRYDSSLDGVGSDGIYSSSSLNDDNSKSAYDLYFSSGNNIDLYDYDRYFGLSVRPVTTKLIVPVTPKVGDQFVDATSGLKFEVTAVSEANTVKVIANNYTGTSYTIPATVKYLDVTFAVTEIGTEAFETCESVQSVTLSEGLITIGTGAFEDCSALVSINIPAGVTTIDTAAFEGCAFTSINLPASVTTLGAEAFLGCESLQSVTLSEGLITIGQMTFVNTGLTSITIPASVTEIGMYAFYAYASSALTSVTFKGTACQNNIGEDAFYNVGNPDPALLTLPNSWTGTKPDEDGNWYGGKFELSEDPTALPTLFGDDVKVNKSLLNGQLIIRKGNKTYNTLGQEVK